jgi:hypothetical protein
MWEAAQILKQFPLDMLVKGFYYLFGRCAKVDNVSCKDKLTCQQKLFSQFWEVDRKYVVDHHKFHVANNET